MCFWTPNIRFKVQFDLWLVWTFPALKFCIQKVVILLFRLASTHKKRSERYLSNQVAHKMVPDRKSRRGAEGCAGCAVCWGRAARKNANPFSFRIRFFFSDSDLVENAKT